MTASQELVTVATFDVPMLASVVRNALLADGIPAVVVDGDMAALLPSEAVGGAKVLVPAEFAADAALKIAAMDQAGGGEADDDDDDEELSRQALAATPEGA